MKQAALKRDEINQNSEQKANVNQPLWNFAIQSFGFGHGFAEDEPAAAEAA